MYAARHRKRDNDSHNCITTLYYNPYTHTHTHTHTHTPTHTHTHTKPHMGPPHAQITHTHTHTQTGRASRLRCLTMEVAAAVLQFQPVLHLTHPSFSLSLSFSIRIFNLLNLIGMTIF